MNDLFPTDPFEPSAAAARARLAAVRPSEYARTRNHIDGAVTRLSPYLTHGLITLPEALAAVLARGPLDVQHKFVYELGWRAYFQHVWQHEGDAIFASLHPGPLPEDAYARALPADIRTARTGVPVIDAAVRELYATGYLHNHARMWLASYVVHLRRVHWRAGADWLYGHLLDGDLASNHLSWQWVAGTDSSKPYLFNADNVARYAPAAMHSAGTVIDASYEALDRIARGVALPGALDARESSAVATAEPALMSQADPNAPLPPPSAALFAGRDLWLVHPWSLRAAPGDLPAGTLHVGLWLADFHDRWPWSAARWRFVSTGMAARAECQCRADAAAWRSALASARSVRGWRDAHLGAALDGFGLDAPPTLFAEPASRCASFSRYWSRVTRGRVQAAELLAGGADR
jgi:deoxyribodipyrimidine photo-lyase